LIQLTGTAVHGRPPAHACVVSEAPGPDLSDATIERLSFSGQAERTSAQTSTKRGIPHQPTRGNGGCNRLNAGFRRTE
jgi:hypothetical protein